MPTPSKDITVAELSRRVRWFARKLPGNPAHNMAPWQPADIHRVMMQDVLHHSVVPDPTNEDDCHDMQHKLRLQYYHDRNTVTRQKSVEYYRRMAAEAERIEQLHAMALHD